MSDRSAEHNNHSCSLKNACECYSEQAKKGGGMLKCGSKYDPKASLEGLRKQEIAVAAKIPSGTATEIHNPVCLLISRLAYSFLYKLQHPAAVIITHAKTL